MDELSVEVGHSNGAYYKVSGERDHWKRRTPSLSLSRRHTCTTWMQLGSMSNTIKSKSSTRVRTTSMATLSFASFFPQAKIPFSENRVRLLPESVDLKKLSPGDPCEASAVESSSGLDQHSFSPSLGTLESERR